MFAVCSHWADLQQWYYSYIPLSCRPLSVTSVLPHDCATQLLLLYRRTDSFRGSALVLTVRMPRLVQLTCLFDYLPTSVAGQARTDGQGNGS